MGDTYLSSKTENSLRFEAPSVTIMPITFNYVSKLVSANLVKGTGTVQAMLTTKMVFSGNRKRKIF